MSDDSLPPEPPKLRRSVAINDSPLKLKLFKMDLDLKDKSNKDIVLCTEFIKKQEIELPITENNLLYNRLILACRSGWYINETEMQNIEKFFNDINSLIDSFQY